MKEIDRKLTMRNIKPTAIRELVLKILSEQKTAINLSDLEHKFEKVDKITLYRTLKIFEENKLIHSINDGSGSVKYALCQEACECIPEDLHVHFLCVKCHQTYCLNDIKTPKIQLPVSYKLQTISIVVKGICPNCD